MTNLIIGNGISAVAAVFTAKSSWASDTEHIYFYQVIQCLLLALASFFFHSYTGIITLLLCAWRNYLASRGKLTGKAMMQCLSMIVVFGVLVNNRGMIGLLLVATNVIYTLGVFFTKREVTIKYNMILNMFLWLLYEIFIIDIPSAIADLIGLLTAAASLLRPNKPSDNKNNHDSKETLP